jgi:hypothetical protein
MVKTMIQKRRRKMMKKMRKSRAIITFDMRPPFDKPM